MITAERGPINELSLNQLPPMPPSMADLPHPPVNGLQLETVPFVPETPEYHANGFGPGAAFAPEVAERTTAFAPIEAPAAPATAAPAPEQPREQLPPPPKLTRKEKRDLHYAGIGGDFYPPDGNGGIEVDDNTPLIRSLVGAKDQTPLVPIWNPANKSYEFSHDYDLAEDKVVNFREVKNHATIKDGRALVKRAHELDLSDEEMLALLDKEHAEAEKAKEKAIEEANKPRRQKRREQREKARADAAKIRPDGTTTEKLPADKLDDHLEGTETASTPEAPIADEAPAETNQLKLEFPEVNRPAPRSRELRENVEGAEEGEEVIQMTPEQLEAYVQARMQQEIAAEVQKAVDLVIPQILRQYGIDPTTPPTGAPAEAAAPVVETQPAPEEEDEAVEAAIEKHGRRILRAAGMLGGAALIGTGVAYAIYKDRQQRR